MAQLGDLTRARALMKSAARGFGPKEAVARARCIVAEAEIALASRDLNWAPKALNSARTILEVNGDRVNAAHARHLEIRRLLLIGQLDVAEQLLSALNPSDLPAALRAVHELVLAGIAMRRIRARDAQAAIHRAMVAAREARIAPLVAEVESAALLLSRPAARQISNGTEQLLLLSEVETLIASNTLIVDACRHVVRDSRKQISLASRPVLFSLARTLAEAWPGDVARDVLLARAFGAKFVDDSHRARLRVEMARLRGELGSMAAITATKLGFALAPHGARSVCVLAWPVDEEHASVLAFLADGEAWSSSALALALGASQRTVQRSVDALAAAGKVQAFGRGRARRWMSTSIPGFTTTLLLPAQLPLN